MPTPRSTTPAEVRPLPTRRTARGGLLLGLAAAAVALSGCGPATTDSPTTGAPTTSTAPSSVPPTNPDELSDAGGRPCPKRLPVGDPPPDHGFGFEEPAESLPTLLQVQEAWVCEYNLLDAGSTPRGGAAFGWERAGQPDPIDEQDLPALQSALDDLALADPMRACTEELGPRWLVVYSHDGDLTGVVVDGYGCRDVRLTDDPHHTAPGSPDQDGTVGGVLDGGPRILEAIGVGRLS